MTEQVYTALYADGRREARNSHTSAEISCCINTYRYVRLPNMAVIIFLQGTSGKAQNAKEVQVAGIHIADCQEQQKALKAH